MLSVIGILLLSATAAIFAVRLYRSANDWGDANGKVVVRVPGQRPVRPQYQRGFVRTPGGIARSESHRGSTSSQVGRKARSAPRQIRKPWGW